VEEPKSLKERIRSLLESNGGHGLDIDLAKKVGYSRMAFENAVKDYTEFPLQRVCIKGKKGNKVLMLPEHMDGLSKVNYYECKITGQKDICYEICKEYCHHWMVCEPDLAYIMGKKTSPDVIRRRVDRFLRHTHGRPEEPVH